jgi:hypothetical protein
MVKWNCNLVNAFPNPYLENIHQPALPSTIPQEPFPFFRLPSELRNRIYALVLFTSTPHSNIYNPCTSLLLASSRLHTEASYLLYSSTTFRIFPLQDFKPLPTVRDLPPYYRRLVTTIELVLGPSWTSPPKSWKVNKSMVRVLGSMASVQTLMVFVEVDPSHPVFAEFRISHGFYTEFCGGLLRDVLKAMPGLKVVQISGRPSVQMDGPLVSRLQREVEAQGRMLKLGDTQRRVSAEDSTSEVALAVRKAVSEHSIWSAEAAEQCPREVEHPADALNDRRARIPPDGADRPW